MRIYEVNFAHRKHGSNYSRETVCVKGYVPEAIEKALRLNREKQLCIESVLLIAEGK